MVFIVLIISGGVGVIVYFNNDLLRDGAEEGSRIIHRILDMPEKVSNGLGQIFQTEVSIEGNSLTLKETHIKELALSQRKIVVVTRYQRKNWANIDAIMIIRGEYEVKGGFDLNNLEPIELNLMFELEEDSLPEPEVLSLTEINREIYFRTTNIMNSITAEDVAAAYEENLEQARKEALESGILEDCTKQFRIRLQELIEIQKMLDEEARKNPPVEPNVIVPERPIE